MEAIWNSIVSNSWDGMLREKMYTNLLPEHPIISLKINRHQNGHLIGKKVITLRLSMISLLPELCYVTGHMTITACHKSFFLHVDCSTLMFLPDMCQ